MKTMLQNPPPFFINKKIGLLLLLFLSVTAVFAQRQVEHLNRGLVAVRTSDSEVFISWRMLGTDPANVAFNLYRGTSKLNAIPIAEATNFTDATSANEAYTVRPVIDGQELAASAPASVWTEPFKRLPLQKPAGGTTPDGVSYDYSPNDCSVGDLNGDGDYEVIVKWNPSNAKDNSQAGYTGNVYLDAYEMDGTRLWRIDLGRNIRAGAHYTQFIVYDLDGDGRAEVACKTADGTIDGAGTTIGNPDVDYRNSVGYVLYGPEYLTVFNGRTGAAMATTDYVPARGNVASWGDDYGNRVDRFLAGVGYFDGQRPSLLMTRGYYTRSVLVAWDWRGGQLTQRWVFDTDQEGNSAYASQGNHSLSINDVDNDGKDEVIFGSMAIDDTGLGLYSTGLGHGDAQHVGDLDPSRPGLESWTAQESPSQYQGNGLWMRDAGTGEKLWGVPSDRDIGRAMTADIDPRHLGYEAWGATGNLYNVKGEQISAIKPGSMNFGSWWDGDLQRELMDGTAIDKWNYTTSTQDRLLSAHSHGADRNNGTKANPGLSADILGDWREEVIYRSSDNTELLIFTTTIPTTHRFYTFMHDPQYRTAIAWQNVGYNQPPHTSFYVGEGMETPPTPAITLAQASGTEPAAIYLTARGGDAKSYLGWSTNNFEMERLEIYRDTDPNPNGSVRIAQLAGTVRSFEDEGLTNGTAYYYWVRGFDSNGVVVNSAAAGATPEETVLPPKPAVLKLSATGEDARVDLTWTIENVDIRHIEIYRDTDSNPSGRSRITIVGATETAYSDQSVVNGTPYWYWLKVLDVNGKYHGSGAATATPEGTTVLPQKEVVLAAAGSDRLVDLSWQMKNFSNVIALEVFRDTDANPTGRVRIASLHATDTTFTDTGVENGIPYWYWIKVTDVAGITNSNAAAATPEALDGTYVLTALHSAKVLDVNKGCAGNAGNANVVQHTAGSTMQQHWQLRSVGEGVYTIINTTCGLALGAKGEDTSSGETNVMVWSYAGSANQQWDLIRLENGSYNIVNRHSGQSLTVADASVADGANVKQAAFTEAENQQFSLTPLGGSTMTKVSEARQRQQKVQAVVYPNPAASEFTIAAEGDFSYVIWDQVGRQVADGKSSQSVQTGTTLKPGLYLIQIISNGKAQQFKLIKKH